MARGSDKGDAAHADHVELVEAPELDEVMPEPEPVRAPVDNSQVAAQATQQREAQPEEPEMLRQRLFTGAGAPPPPPPRKLREPGGDDESAPPTDGAVPPPDDDPEARTVGPGAGARQGSGPPAPVGRPVRAAGWGSGPREPGRARGEQGRTE